MSEAGLSSCELLTDMLMFVINILFLSDFVDILNLPRICCHPAPAVHGQQNRRGRDHNQPLPVCPGLVPSTVPTELDLQILFRWVLRLDSCSGRLCANYSIL